MRTLFLSALLAALPLAGGTLPVPLSPILLEYEFAEQQLRQWIAGHARYDSIEAFFYEKDGTDLCMVLSEKQPSLRSYYCNDASRVELLMAEGKQARLTSVDVKRTEAGPSLPAGFGFAFRDGSGTAVRWRFLPTTEPSKRGGGLTPLEDVAGLALHHRRIGTAAASGTAVQIGDQVYEAEPWPEISVPPYFVAHRGTFSVGVHMFHLRVGEEQWTVTSAPDVLRVGAQWKLRNGRGQLRVIELVSFQDGEATVRDGRRRWQGKLTQDGFQVREAAVVSGDRTARVQFSYNAAAAITFEVLGGDDKLSSGSIVSSGGTTLRWQFRSPEWARSKRIEGRVEVQGESVKIGVREDRKR